MVAYTQWGSDGPVSRRLLLLRHAAAEFSGGQDHNRPLSTTGRAQARAQGVHMLAASLVPQSVICSSALRTRTTLDLLLDQWGKHAAKIDIDRKSTRLNSSHVAISYAVFCLKKKITNKYKRQS